MVRPPASPETTPILQLLSDYSFDVDTSAEAMVTGWLQRFEPAWVSQAITEALYQGRYKMVSVDHILQLWQRRGQPLRHFNREFESIILGQSWGQFLAATKANAAANRDSEPSSSLSMADAMTKAASDHHLHYPTQTIEAQGNGHSVPISPFGADLSQPNHDSAYHPFHLPATASFPVSEPDPAEANPAFVGASARTIPPLTPDQLARLTQPAIAPELAHTPLPTPPQNPPPIDESATEALTAEFLTDEPLLTADALTAEAAELSEADKVIASHRPPAQNFYAAGVTESVIPFDAERRDVIVAATDTAEDATVTMTATEDPTEVLLPEPESFGDNTETAQVVIPNFQPVAGLASHPESADSIPPFVPNPGPSDFHQRLKAVVEAGRQEN